MPAGDGSDRRARGVVHDLARHNRQGSVLRLLVLRRERQRHSRRGSGGHEDEREVAQVHLHADHFVRNTSAAAAAISRPRKKLNRREATSTLRHQCGMRRADL